MNKIMSTFKSLYNATQEALHKVKEPLVESKNKRAFDSAIDSAKDLKIDAEEALERELAVVKDGQVIDVNKVLEYKQLIKDADETIIAIQEIKDSFFK